MAAPNNPPPTRILSWEQMVLESDPTFRQYSLRPWVYEFSNGRRFIQPQPVYGNSLFIEGITLVPVVFQGGAPDGTLVGLIDVQMSDQSLFLGTLQLGGPSASSFAISGTTLVTVGTVPPGTYQITIIANGTAVVNSPFSVSFTLTGTAVLFPTADVVTDHIFIQQQQPWHPGPALFAGRPPQVGASPGVRRSVFIAQEQPFHPGSFARTGGSPLFVIPPSVARSIFVQQENGRPWHPLPFIYSSPPLAGQPPEITDRIIVAQEMPWHPTSEPFVRAGRHPFFGVNPAITDSTFTGQEQPWHPRPWLQAGRSFVAAIIAPVGAKTWAVVSQEAVPYQPSWTLRGPQPAIGQDPSITDLIRVSQERPWHPNPFVSVGSALTVSPESPPGTDVTNTTSSINASPTSGSPGFGNVTTITSGGALAINGTTIGGASVTEIYYIAHTVFQFGSGAWYGPVNGSTTGTAIGGIPQPQVFLSSNTIGGSPANGSPIGTISVTVGNGTVTNPYTFTYTLSDNTHFQVVGSTLETKGTVAGGSYPLTITATNSGILGGPWTVATTITVSAESQDGTSVPGTGSSINASSTPGTAGSGNVITIVSGQVAVNGTVIAATSAVTALYYIGHTAFQFGSGAWYGPITASSGGSNVADPHPTVQLSSTSVTAGAAAGTVVGAISTAVGAGTFTWSYSLSGTDAAKFAISGSNLVTAISVPSGTYSVTITATNAGIIGQPFSTTFSISASSAASVNFPITGGIASTDNNATENTLAQRAGQPNNIPTGDTQYTFYNNKSWSIWAGFETNPQRPYYTLQQACWPTDGSSGTTAPNWGSGSGFNPTEFITGSDALAGYQTFANNLAASNVLSRCICVNIGWEWNKGGAMSNNDQGWDQPGQQSNYIQWFRTVAGYIRAAAPNMLIGWIGNGTSMTGGSGWVQEDFYPGDDVVDVIGDDIYGAFCQGGTGPGTVNATDRSNYFGWCTQFSAGTNLGNNHPAKASGSMTYPFGGQSVRIPFGGKKWIACPEMQDTASFSTWIPDMFNWVNNTVKGRILVTNYWDGYNVGNGTVLTTSNTQGSQWVTGTTGHIFNGTLPIPKLS